MNLTDLSQYAQIYDADLIKKVKEFLDRTDVKNTKGAQRIEVVCENFKFLSFEQAYHLIDPDTFQDEFEEAHSYKAITKGLNYGRIFLSIAPLVFTWFALFSATSGYQDDLSKHPEDKVATFLQLWQDGFHHTTPFTFSTTAFIDVIILLLLLACNIIIVWLEYRAQEAAKKFAKDLNDITEGLLKAVNTEGVSPVTAQADIDKIVKAVRVALGGVFTTTEDVIKQALDVVLKANDRAEQLFTNQVQPLFSKFEQNVSVFHLDVNQLTQDVGTIAAASTNLATSSTNMASSTSDMVNSANGLQASIKQIDSHIVALNKTEGEMATKIEISQQNVANEMKQAASSVTSASSKLGQAAQKVETIGQTLATINPQNVQQMSDNATLLADKVDETVQALRDTIDGLKKVNGQSGIRRTKKLLGLFSI